MFWIRQGIQKGRRDFEGRSFRAAADGRGSWEPALSLDVVITDHEGKGEEVTFLDVVHVDDSDPADEALRDSNAAALLAASMSLCRDELDRAVMIATAQGTPLGQVAREFGVSRETPRNRLKWITGRMRHPTMRDRIRPVAS